MVELEQQLAGWVDDQQGDVAPVTADEVLDPASTPPGSLGRRRRAGQLALAAAAVLVVVAGVAAVVRSSADDPAPVRTGDTTTTTVPLPGDGWTTFEAAGGRTILVPPGWSAATYQAPEGCERVQEVTVLANRRQPVVPAAVCGPVMGSGLLSSPGLLALVVVAGAEAAPNPDETVLPTTVALDLETFDPKPAADAQGNPLVPSSSGTLWSDAGDGDLVRVTVHLADGGLEEQRAELDEVLVALHPSAPDGSRTIAQRAGTSSTATTILCAAADGGTARTAAAPTAIQGAAAVLVTWAASEGVDEQVARCRSAGRAAGDRTATTLSPWPATPGGPSQSAADAERDGVVPELAARALEDRAFPLALVDAPEGSWGLSVIPNTVDEGSCAIGDETGTWGSDWICDQDYAELVLVSDAGAVERAVPLPGLVPRWMIVTADAVYAGLTDAGDQDEAPAGAIARVDRRSLEARIVAFPPDGDILAVERPEWSTAPDGSTYDDLVRPAEAPAPPEMVLALGPEAEPAPLAVDLAAVEELFT